MWAVKVSLRQPVTIIVMLALILLFGIRSALQMPIDMFPDIRIPVVATVWLYNGLLPDEMANRIVYYFERIVTVMTSDVKAIESQSVIGYGVIKLSFQPGANVTKAVAQVTGAAQTVLRFMPEGTTPPYVLAYNASSVPVIQLALSGQGLTPYELFDVAMNYIRPQFASIAGSEVPIPYGGLNRTVQADLNLQAMQANHVSPQDVVNALSNQNLIIPAGTQKIGPYEWHIKLNSAPDDIDSIDTMPVKKSNGTVIYMHDIANVHDGAPPQTNLVHINGSPAVLLPVIKVGSVSTLDVISGAKALLPRLREALPQSLRIDAIGDQSVFVHDAVSGVVREAALAAVLTGLMVLMFLGSWRLTAIITVTIPLSILVGLIGLQLTGETINVMTLGGFALAVGLLVDNATVTLENISTHLEMGKDIESAILEGAAQIVLPSFVSLLAICIVFVPMFQLGGVSGFLFVPLAESVIYAMIGAFLLSITIVPLMAKFLLSGHDAMAVHGGGHGPPTRPPTRNPLKLFQRGFESGFLKFRDWFRGVLVRLLQRPVLYIAGFLAVVIASVGLLGPWLGNNFFPQVDGGAIALHVRAPTGMRIEETARLCDQIEKFIRTVIPANEITNIVDNIDLPYSPVDMAYNNTGTIGPEDADIWVQEAEDHQPTALYSDILRRRLPAMFPGVTFAFLPADIRTQILNFGNPAPIDVQVVGPDQQRNFNYASQLLAKIAQVPGVVDARIQQRFDYPELYVNVNRSLAQEVGITQADVATSVLDTLSGSFQVRPNFYLNPKNGISYELQAMMPQYRIDSLSDLANLPITGNGSGPGSEGGAIAGHPASTGIRPQHIGAVSGAGEYRPQQILGAIATIKTVPSAAAVSHYNVQPVIDIYAGQSGRDLGGINHDVQQILADAAKDRPPGSRIVVRGQVQTMAETYSQLFLGLIGSLVLIYLMICVNFQSWLDPFVIITALPAAFAGIVWMLFLTGTPLSVPALTGSIMTMGVASANSILVVSFARERLAQGLSATEAAIDAGYARLRPVLMTAGAMMIGMLPMASGLSDAQNAPLGRAVIGGLLLATVSTLTFVPAVFSIVHRHANSEQEIP